MSSEQQKKRGTVIDDLARFRVVSDPQMSPDGGRAAYVVKTTNLEKNRYESHIWAVATDATDGAEVPRQWTRSTASEERPRWSPYGDKLAFTSGREEKVGQIWILPAEGGGEAEKVTDLPPGSIGDLRWSPDGLHIAFTFRPQDEERRESAAEERKKANRSSPPREITRRRYREEGEGFTPTAPYQIHVLDVTSGTVSVVTSGERDARSFCWSPDGSEIAFARNIAEGDPDLLPNAVGIYVQPSRVLAEGEEPRLLSAPRGPKGSLAWSPDGKRIAYLGHDRETEVWGLTNPHPWVVAVDGSGARDLAPNWDVACGDLAIGDMTGGGEAGPVWAADSRSLLVLASDRGAVNVVRAALEGAGEPQPVTEGKHVVAGFTLDANRETLALLRATPTDAGDIYTLPASGGEMRRLTSVNDDLLDEIALPEPFYFEAEVADGRKVPCWALRPPESAGDGPHPTILYIHGGPHLMYAHQLFHEYQALAAAGYAVLFPNPRGSKGYGQAWTSAIKGNWGEPAQADCLACVDYAVEQGWADGERLGVAGGSYGGYLTGWIVGHSDRFRAAVAERGVYNLQSMAGTCDFVWRDHDYFDADNAGDPGDYLRNSPLTYADAIHTPTLLIHSEGDLRCPIEQCEQFFTALKLRGRDVTFLRYGPESNHNLSRGGPPDLRLDRQRRIHAWFERYLRGHMSSQKGGDA